MVVKYPLSPLGEKLKAAIDKEGLQVQELAELIGTDRTHLSKIMHGRVELSERFEKALASVLGGDWSGEFIPPANDNFGRQLIESKMQEKQEIPVELVAEVLDVQHGRKECVDYSRFSQKNQETAVTYEELVELMLDMVEQCPNNIYEAYGKAVFAIARGKEAAYGLSAKNSV